jgi:hypothetical protein
VAGLTLDDELAAKIDAGATSWWQGDIANANWFRVSGNKDVQLAAGERCSATDSFPCSFQETDGLVLLTQTCDIRKSCRKRPYVTVSPLVQLEGTDASFAKRGRILNFVPVPAAGAQAFADIDRVMTIEKSLLLDWQRATGFSNDNERRNFSRRIARVYQRFAFPDDLHSALYDLVERVRKKCGKNDLEGKALDAIEEIRVTATPDWESHEIEVFLTFAPTDGASAPEITEEQWANLLEGWLKLCKPVGVIKTVTGTVLPLDELTARDYLDSDRLELEYLSP